MGRLLVASFRSDPPHRLVGNPTLRTPLWDKVNRRASHGPASVARCAAERNTARARAFGSTVVARCSAIRPPPGEALAFRTGGRAKARGFLCRSGAREVPPAEELEVKPNRRCGHLRATTVRLGQRAALVRSSPGPRAGRTSGAETAMPKPLVLVRSRKPRLFANSLEAPSIGA